MTAGLGKIAARGAGITLMSQVIRFALQLGSLTVLARLLSPQDFGVVAMVTAITNVMEIVRDAGLSSAAIQAKELSDAERTNLFWANTGIGAGCALVVTLSAPLIVRIYSTPVVGPIVLALAPLFIVSGVNTQFRAELSRSLRFKALAVTDIAAQAGSIAVAISLAAAGAGHWAVVGQQITLVVLICTSNVILCKWRPGRPRRSVSIRRFFRFGGSVLGTNVIGYAANNLDNVAIGIYSGSGPLGLYSRAYQLLMVPLAQVNVPLTRVVLPVLSRVQDDDETYARYVRKAQLVGCYMLATGFAVAAGVSVPLVALLFGPKWSGVAPIFAALAIGGIFRGLEPISYWMFLSRGRADAQLKLNLVAMPIMVGIMIAGLPWGPVGVAIGHSIGFFLYWIVSLWTAGRCVRTSVRPLFTQATRTLLLISLPAGALAYIGSVLVQPTAASLCLGVALGVGYLALVALISPAERANLDLMMRVLLGRSRTGRVLGPNHSDALLGAFAAITVPAAAPDTQATRKKLATAYQDTGRAAEAVPLLERTSADPKRILRFDPPGIQTSRKNLAEAHPAVDRVADAIPPPEQTLVVRKSRPPDGAAGQKGPAGFRRPPAASARQPLPSSVARPPVKLTDHSSTSRTPEPPRKDGQSDREIVAAITAGDPAAIAMAYDRYAEALYGYSHWVLHDSAAATGALKDAFVIAVAMLSNLSEPSKLRPWLFALARNECRRRIRPASAVRYGEADAGDELADAGDYLSDATVQSPVISLLADPITPFRVIGQPTYGPGRVNDDQGQAELRSLLHSILVALKPREREVIELSFRHDLNDNDLAIVLGVSQSQAHDLATRARGRLEEALGALHIALTGREACPVLGELLTDWDGQLTEQTRDLVVRHMGECQTCAHRGWRAMRPAAFFRLLPLAPLPQELREQVLSLCTSAAEDAVAYHQAPPAPPAPSTPAVQAAPSVPRTARGSRRRWAKVGLVAGVLAVVAAGSVGAILATSGSKPPKAVVVGPVQQATVASWVTGQVDPATVISCDPAMCAALVAHHYPSKNVHELSSPAALKTSGVVVVTPVALQLFGSSLVTAWAPAALATFGSGSSAVSVRLVAPDGAAAYERAAREDQAVRASSEASLVGTKSITVKGAAARDLDSGQVDGRLFEALAAAAYVQPIDIVDFGNTGSGASAGVPFRYADLAASNSAAGPSGPAYLQMLRISMRGSPGPRPARTQLLTLRGGQQVLRVEYLAPGQFGVLNP